MKLAGKNAVEMNGLEALEAISRAWTSAPEERLPVIYNQTFEETKRSLEPASVSSPTPITPPVKREKKLFG